MVAERTGVWVSRTSSSDLLYMEISSSKVLGGVTRVGDVAISWVNFWRSIALILQNLMTLVWQGVWVGTKRSSLQGGLRVQDQI